MKKIKKIIEVLFVPITLVIFITFWILYMIMYVIEKFIYDANLTVDIEPRENEVNLKEKEITEYLRIKEKYHL